MGVRRYASCPEIVAIHTNSQNEFWKRVRKEGVSRLIKGSRFLLLANSENIVNHNGMSKLQLALEVNKPLSQAYYLKEDFRQVYTRKHHFCLKEREPRMVSWKALYSKGRRHQVPDDDNKSPTCGIEDRDQKGIFRK